MHIFKALILVNKKISRSAFINLSREKGKTIVNYYTNSLKRKNPRFLMKWEDLVLTGAGIVFSYALVPQVIYNFKKKVRTVTRQTGLITTLGLASTIAADYSLGLELAASMTSLTTVLWGMLTYQSFAYPEIKNQKGLESKL